MSDRDNLDWYIHQCHHAYDRARLDEIAIMIDYAKWEDEEWTRDDDGMMELREAWKAKAIEHQSEQTK